MAHITVDIVNSWTDKVKLNVAKLDSDLEDSVSVEVLAVVSHAYDVSGWIDSSTTPALIQKIIGMWYVGWFFQRTYSEDDGINTYGVMLLANAQTLLNSIVTGTIVLPDAGANSNLNISNPLYYPTDASSSIKPSDTGWSTEFGHFADQSVGEEKFSMGSVF
jgi:hypothetical protein